MSRSLLFVPGDSRRKFDKAAGGDADALILDLEDSVAPDTKPEARGLVHAMLTEGAGDKALWVRVNALDTGLTATDLAAVVSARPYGIVFPKSRGGEDVARLDHYLEALEAAAGIPVGHTRILVIATEVGSGMFGLGSYRGASERLWGLSWGAEDLAADLGALTNREDGRVTEPYRIARSFCLYAAAHANTRAVDTVCVDIHDADLLREETVEARRDGFVAKVAIHPNQIPVINAAFEPSAEEVAHAERIVAAFAENPGTGAFQLDGQMVDIPHLRAARRLLENRRGSG